MIDTRLPLKTRVLFMCLRNDNRSPMAEAWVNHLYGDFFEAISAGLEPWPIHPLAVRVMEEVGIFISAHHPQRVFDLVVRDELFSYAVTLWDQGHYERRAYFPGYCIRLLWDLPNPTATRGEKEPALNRFRKVRDELKVKIEGWMPQVIKEKSANPEVTPTSQGNRI